MLSKCHSTLPPFPKGNVTGFLTPNQTAQRYLDEMKARPGWRKLADNISTSLTAALLGGTVHAPPPP